MDNTDSKPLKPSLKLPQRSESRSKSSVEITSSSLQVHKIIQTPGYERISMLTNHKSKLAKCELCNNIGHLVCDKCKVTFYCTVDHYVMDKEFHVGLCERIKQLRMPIEFHPLSETRERWAKQRRICMEELYLDTLKKAKADLEVGNYNAAIPSATVSCKYARILYGWSEEMIAPMLIAAESYLHMGKLSVADGYLARAQSIEMALGNMKPSNKAGIRRNEGLMALARGQLHTALYSFAEEIYQSTEEFGPEHIRTSLGYCFMGHVFHLSKKFNTSSSLLRQTVEIWRAFVEPIFAEMTEEKEVPQIAGVKTGDTVFLEECDKFEAMRILTQCFKEQEECFMSTGSEFVTYLDLAKTCYTLGIVHFICERYSELESKVAEALSWLEQGGLTKHPISQKLFSLSKHSSRKSYLLEKMSTDGGRLSNVAGKIMQALKTFKPSEKSEKEESVQRTSRSL